MNGLVVLLRLNLFFCLLLMAFSAAAANKYVRAGAGGTGTGADWTNAYTSLPNPLTRGDTYYIADGSYSGYTFDDDASNTTPITIKKCTASDHGTETGYSSAYCDGQAVFGSLQFTRPYYVIDGSVRNESNWKDYSAYGIRTTGVRASRLDGGHIGNACSADNITFKYLHAGSTTTAYSSRIDGEAFYIAGFGGGTVACENWTLHRTLIQNVVVGIQCAGCKGLNVEYSYFYIGWGKEAIRGQLHAADMMVRWSVFEDSCQKDPDDATSGCTGEIATWGGESTGDYDNTQIYGNVFYKTTTEVNSGGVVVVGGNGSTWLGVPANNAKVYNNTIAGFKNWNANILINGGSGNECRNNLWYGNTGSNTGCTANSSSNNIVASSNPFVNYSGGDFRLSGPTAAGYLLSSPYNVDLLGNTRGADGNWDLGAYEYVSGGDGIAPSVTIATTDPSSIVTNSLTVTGTASDAVGVSGCKWRRTSAPDANNGTACTGTNSFSCATSGYAQGANTLYVGCYDAAGNYGSDSIVVNFSLVTQLNPPTNFRIY